ncbi:MAG: MotA/TolQ/ExbB proton channel family protein [Proteobacteria bacterium]|nr:MotA/TolQ/ExbB proton channel family protein [Pseudomonadota bacterium]MBU1418482.1 MotA/TolQ/ExbB proton channel family protein [Pseudomonadota bacterium]MBU1455013.1 MotA/TolQ/ExbB proton channel family protein [Pseudomonadota bacterium]
MWPLLACSLMVFIVVMERALFWLTIRRQRDHELLDEALTIAERGDWQLIRERTNGCNDYIIRMLGVGILHREYDMAKAMEAQAQETIHRMSKGMSILDTMITVAPLLGIFGTVLGIISSFNMLGAGGIADPKLVTGGIAQALITTAAGLGISIISVFPYNYFRSRIEHSVHTMEKYATSLEVVYEKLLERGRGTR